MICSDYNSQIGTNGSSMGVDSLRIRSNSTLLSSLRYLPEPIDCYVVEPKDSEYVGTEVQPMSLAHDWPTLDWGEISARIFRAGRLPHRPIDSAALTKGSALILSYLLEYGDIPEPLDIMSDEEEGLLLSWRQGSRYFDATWPKEGDAYLYYSTPNDYGVEEGPLTPALLGKRLDWIRTGK